MDKAIPIVGTPRQTAYDLLLWQTELAVIEALHDYTNGDEQAMRIVSKIHALTLWSPQYVISQTKPEDFPQFLTAQEKGLQQFNTLDFAWQLKAMLAHDISKSFGGSMERVASNIKANVLVIVSQKDHMVNSEPALSLARKLGTEILELTSDCGHMAVGCEMETIRKAISRFLGGR